MNYEVVYDGSTKVELSHGEMQQFVRSIMSGQEYVQVREYTLTKFFKCITPKVQTEGRLHDGTRVVRLNGRWVDAGNPSLVLDASYYPEVASDEVMTEEEYGKKRLTSGDLGSRIRRAVERQD